MTVGVPKPRFTGAGRGGCKGVTGCQWRTRAKLAKSWAGENAHILAQIEAPGRVISPVWARRCRGGAEAVPGRSAAIESCHDAQAGPCSLTLSQPKSQAVIISAPRCPRWADRVGRTLHLQASAASASLGSARRCAAAWRNSQTRSLQT